MSRSCRLPNESLERTVTDKVPRRKRRLAAAEPGRYAPEKRPVPPHVAALSGSCRVYYVTDKSTTHRYWFTGIWRAPSDSEAIAA